MSTGKINGVRVPFYCRIPALRQLSNTQLPNTGVLFHSLAIIFGLAFLLLTPPLQSPDEGGHFVRAYQLATEGLHAISPVTFDVSARPAIAQRFSFWQQKAINHDLHHQEKYTLEDYRADFIDHPSVSQPNFMSLAHSQAIMMPFAYFPQATAMAIGLFFQVPFVVLLLFARFFNFIVCYALTCLAIRLTPFHKLSFIAINILPMTVFLRSQLSTDGLVIASAQVALALFFLLHHRAQQKPTPPSQYLLIALSLDLFLLALCKSTYLVLFALWPLLLPWSRKSWTQAFLCIAPALALSLGWGHFISQHNFSIPGDRAGLLDPTAKLAMLSNAPFDVFLRITRTLARHLFDWTGQMIGLLGHADIPLPLVLRFLAFFWLCLIVWLERPSIPVFKRFQVSGLIALFWGQVFLVLLTIFLIWADPSSPYIGGVQGRYFLPLLPCFLIGAANAFPMRRKDLPLSEATRSFFVFCPAFLLLGTALWCLVQNEWG